MRSRSNASQIFISNPITALISLAVVNLCTTHFNLTCNVCTPQRGVRIVFHFSPFTSDLCLARHVRGPATTCQCLRHGILLSVFTFQVCKRYLEMCVWSLLKHHSLLPSLSLSPYLDTRNVSTFKYNFFSLERLKKILSDKLQRHGILLMNFLI